MISLYDYQEDALKRLNDGNILCGKVGSGKSLTGLFYFIRNHSEKELFIITVAKKRDDKEWDKDLDILGISATVDSWNNIHKYTDVKDAFFIFDEQRAVGTGTWGKCFVKIAKKNKWIMLTGTPGDNWKDYISVFLANRFYRTKTEFIERHIEYVPWSKFPQIKKYHAVDVLERYRKQIIVPMKDTRTTKINRVYIETQFNKNLYKSAMVYRVDPFTDEPISNPSKLVQVLRKILYTSDDRKEMAKQIIRDNKKIIVFYNFKYELEVIKTLCDELKRPYKQWNGSCHESVPDGSQWAYLVQYTAGAEAWNCITTNVELFYSLNYAYRIMEQSEGRINRINTPFEQMNYYILISRNCIDDAVKKAVMTKNKFNERNWLEEMEITFDG